MPCKKFEFDCQTLRERMKTEKANGNIQTINRIPIVLAAADGFSFDAIAGFLRVSAEAVRLNFNKFVPNGPKGLKTKKRPGGPSKPAKSQRRLKKTIADGSEEEVLKLFGFYRDMEA